MATALRKFETLPSWVGPVAPEPESRDWLVPSSQYRHERRCPMIDTFVVHATAGGSSSGAMSVPQSGGRASWHWLVPDEDEKAHGRNVWRCVPDSGAAWHVLSFMPHPVDGYPNSTHGGWTINDRSFGVEVVNWQDGRDKFSDWQLRVTAQMVRYAWSHYGVKYLVTHSYLDPARRDDPTTIFNWDLFMDYVMDGHPSVEPYHPGPVKIVWLSDSGPRLIDCGAELRADGRTWVRALSFAAFMGWPAMSNEMVPLRPLCDAHGLEPVDHIPDQRKVYLRAKPA